MRLKISFKDIKALFDYLDKKKTGEINYDDFTLLLEERWRGIDSIQTKISPLKQDENKSLDIFEPNTPEHEVIRKLEDLATNKLKVPLNKKFDL